MTKYSLPTTISSLLDNIFAYGIDWTEYKDKSEHDHEVSTYAGKIKEELKESLTLSLLAAFEKHLLSLPSMQMEYRETLDMGLSSWTSEDFKAFGRNELRTQLIKENKL